MAKSKLYTVDKFLGLNEAADGMRELKMGEASRSVNFAITDGFNLTVRPGISRGFYDFGHPCALWSGYIKDNCYMIVGTMQTEAAAYSFTVLRQSADGFQAIGTIQIQPGAIGEAHACKIFTFFGDLVIYLGSEARKVIIDNSSEPPTVSVEEMPPYVPLIITGANPQGGGASLENLNILSDHARLQFSANIIPGSDTEENPDGTLPTVYVLPEGTQAVTAISVDNEALDMTTAGTFDPDKHAFTFATAPIKGVNNVEFTILYKPAELLSARQRFASMPCVEAYNGPTDSRLFFYGDGTNITYYTGVTEYGRGSAVYLPAMNEIAVDASDSPITGMTRHYSKLLVFKPDCTASVSYEPMTLEDGSLIAGFNMRTIHKTAGHQPLGQVKICNNFPRTIAGGNLYEWRAPPSTANGDERYAKNISDPICKTLAAADPKKIIACDDNSTSTYYLFLNDALGTVLVNRYELDVWTIYRSSLMKNVYAAAADGDTMVFLAETMVNGMPCTNLYYLDKTSKYDVPIQPNPDLRDPIARPDTDATAPVFAQWHTGYMDFGADYLRKFSSNIYVSLLPESSSRLVVTAATDRQDAYTEKSVGSGLFNYAAIDYAHWSYNFSNAPKMRRLKLKVKKFVFYKLIFKVDEPGTTATILGYDQQVRYGSNVK